MTALRLWSLAALAALALGALTDIGAGAVLGHHLVLVNRLLVDPGSVSQVEGEASDQAVHMVSVASLVLLVLTAVAFIGWLFIAARAARRIRPDALRFGPGWAIGSWFVPILCWLRPPKIVNDVWAAGGRWGQRETRSPLVGWWWAAFLVSNLSAGLVPGLVGGANTLVAAQDQAVVDIVGYVIDFVAGVLAIGVVAVVTNRLVSWIAPDGTPVSGPPGTWAAVPQPGVLPNPAPQDWTSGPEVDERWERWTTRH
jgi:hypothetical protein